MEATEENVIEIQLKRGLTDGNMNNERRKTYCDENRSACPNTDISNTITFWNIEQDDSIVKLDAFNDTVNSVHDADELVDKLEQNESPNFETNVEECSQNLVVNAASAMDKFIPSKSDPVDSLSGEGTPGDINSGTVADKETFTNDKNRDTGNSSNDDSDIVEINVNFDSLEREGRAESVDKNMHKRESSAKPFQEQKSGEMVPNFTFMRTESNRPFNKESNQNVDDAPNPWSMGIDDPENIFTKSLILSGITELSQPGPHKRPLEEMSSERQPKRAKIEPMPEHYDNDKVKHQASNSLNGESSEFCPPVAVVFPMEPDIKKFEGFGQCVGNMKEDGLKPHNQIYNPQMNNQMQKLIPRDSEQKFSSDKMSVEGKNGSSFHVEKDQSENVSQCAKNVLHDSLGNFEFDFEIQESKDDLPIDITPTINHLDEYEDVLAGLLADARKPIKEPVTSQINTSVPLIQPSVALKDQIDCVPPNVTFSAAWKSVSSTLDRLQSSSYPQSIAKNIEYMMASSTMKPVQNVSSSGYFHPEPPFANGVRKQIERKPCHLDIPTRSDGNFNLLQTFSLHNDSNLLRKMISTPITDARDTSVPNSALSDCIRKASELKQSIQKDFLNTSGENKTENSISTDVKDHSNEALQVAQSKPQVPGVGDKPALSELVRARVTLHHTGTKEQQPDISNETVTESRSRSSFSPVNTSQLQCPPHLQQPLTVKTHNMFNRGMQDVLLQHSLRRKQLAMSQQCGEQNVPSAQYGGHIYQTGIPHGNRYAEIPQQRRGPSPFSQIPESHPGNPSTKYDLSMLEKGYISQMQRQRAEMGRPEPTQGSYNTHQIDMVNTLNSSSRMSHDQLHQQRHQLNPYSHPNFRSSMLQAGMPASMPSHLHSLLKHQDNRHTNGNSGQINANPSLLGQRTHPAGMAMPRLPGHVPKDPFSNLSAQQFSHAHASMYHRHPLHHRPQLDRNAQQAGTQMPFVSDYRQMANRAVSPSESNPYASMNPSMRSHIEDRMSAAGSSQADMVLRNSHQYSSGMAGQPSNYGVR